MWLSNLSVPSYPLKENLTFSPDRTTSGRLPCRDPFILRAGKKYYLYHSGGRRGILCSVSDDLEHWSDPVTVFAAPEDFHGTKDFFWAPECHYYKGNFYIITSVFSAQTGHRSISVYRASDPLGPFADIAGGCISPRDWDAIDGTLYLDEAGDPWMIFVHEWTSMPEGNGGMAAARLAPDFSHLISDPIELFRARDLPFAVTGVTDGPFAYRSDGGRLFLLWSNFSADGYIVTVAESENGRLDGKWKQSGAPLYKKGGKPEWIYDGGHAMIFPRGDGSFLLSLHTPNHRDTTYEHLSLLPVSLAGDGIFL